MPASDRRLPQAGELFLDHVGHFVPDRAVLAAALAAAGFVTTPEAMHTVPGPDGLPVPAGTGNLCVMLQRGYLEFLFRSADTPLAAQFDRAVARHPGVHLAAFATAEPEATAARLADGGFAPQPPVALRRMAAEMEARFTVVRVPPEAMPEGRVQFVAHHTEDAVWQPQWLSHANGAQALLGLMLAVVAPEAAARRWAAFLGRPAHPVAGGFRIATERGDVLILSATAAADVLGESALPAPPAFPAYALEVADLGRAAAAFAAGGLTVRRSGRCLTVPFPAALGRGVWTVVENAADLPWPVL